MVGGVEEGAGRDGNREMGTGGVAEGSGRKGSRELDAIGGVPELPGRGAANREMGTIGGVAED